MAKRQLTGIIVSNKMKKTVVVRVERVKEHLKYKRRYKVQKKYKAHYDEGEFLAGDKVVIEECRPMSKDKKWKVIKKVNGKSSGDETAASVASAPGGLDI
jgi:small subunit ribosomal protein S17